MLISPSSHPDCYCSSRQQEGLFNTIKLWEIVTVRTWLHAIWSRRKIFKERRCLPVSALYCKVYVYTQTLTGTCIREGVCGRGGKSCLQHSVNKFPLTLAGQSSSSSLCKCWDLVQAHSEHFAVLGWHLGSNPAGAGVPVLQPSPKPLLAQLRASHLGCGEFSCLQGTGALPHNDLAHLKGLARVFGCLFAVGLGIFSSGFFSLLVCLLICVWFNLKVGELPSFSLFPK